MGSIHSRSTTPTSSTVATGQCGLSPAASRGRSRSSSSNSSRSPSPRQTANPVLNSRHQGLGRRHTANPVLNSGYQGAQPLAQRRYSFADDAALEISHNVSQPEEEMLSGGPLSISTKLEYTALKKSEEYNVFGLVSLEAAESAENTEVGSSGEEARSSMDITCVLDVSGSMQGEKIDLVKRAMRFIIEEMTSADRLSIVTFNNDSERKIALTRMDDAGKDAALQAVMRLCAGGGTVIQSGLECGVAIMEQRRQRNPVGSVFLLTDGRNNSAIPPRSIENLIERARNAHASVYAFGFGTDHDTAALSRIAESARTPFTFVEHLDTISQAFAGAVGGLASVAAQNIELSIRPENGCTLVAVHTHFTHHREGGEGSAAVVTIPDAFAGERRDIVVELKVPAAAGAQDSSALIMNAQAKYRTVHGQSVVQTPVASLEVQRSVEPEGEPDAEVVAQRDRVVVTNTLEQAIAQGEQGNFDEARSMLQQQADRLRVSKGCSGVKQALMQEVEDAQNRLSSATSYRLGGRAEMTDALWMHRTQRSTNMTASGRGGMMKASKAMYCSRSSTVAVAKSLR